MDRSTRIFVPLTARPTPAAEGGTELRIQGIDLGDGAVALPTFSELEPLLEAYGPDQQWAEVPQTALTWWERQEIFDVVLLDDEVHEVWREAREVPPMVVGGRHRA